MVVVVDDQQVPGRCHEHAQRRQQTRQRGRALVAAVARRAAAGDRVDDAVRAHAANAVRSGVGDEDVPLGVDRHVGRELERGRHGRDEVVAREILAGAGDGPDGPARGVEPADALIAHVGDEHVAGRIERNVGRIEEARRRGGQAVAVEAAGAVARHRLDVAGRVDLADAMVVEVGDVERSGRVERQTGRTRDLRSGGRPTVTAESGHAVADDRVDVARRVDRAHAMMVRVGEDHVARAVDDDVGWAVEANHRRGNAVDAVERRAVARDGGDGARGTVDLADAVVPAVGHEEVARRVCGHALDQAERCIERRTVVAAEAGDAVAGDGRERPVRECTHAMRVALREEDAPIGRRRDAHGCREGTRRRGDVVTTEACRPRAGQRRHRVVREAQLPDAVVLLVGEDEVAADDHRVLGLLERDRRAGAIAREACRAVPGHGRDDAALHAPNAMVRLVADVGDVAGREHDTGRELELGVDRVHVLTREARRAVAREDRGHAERRHHEDAVAGEVHDVEVARRVLGHVVRLRGRERGDAAPDDHRVDEARVLADAADAGAVALDDQDIAVLGDHDAYRVLELRLIRRPAVALGALQRAGERRDGARAGIDAPDAMVLRVGDEDRAVGPHGDAGRRIERRRGGRPAITDAPARDRMNERRILRPRPRGGEQSRHDDSQDDVTGKAFHGPSCPSAARRVRLPVSAAV